MKKVIKTIKKRKIFYLSIITLIIIVISSKYILSTFSLLEPVKSITITSNNVSYANHDKGSWKIDKSAKWTSPGKARITFDIDTIAKIQEDKYTDVIMVLDVSESMNGDKIDRVKSDSIDLINSILTNNHNKVGLITFESSSSIVSDLTNNKNALIEQINSLFDDGRTNYYRALENVDNILKNYTKENNRDCIVLFLTDGYPNEETPNEVGEYKYLKDAYPYITINGIQYEMGDTVLEPIKKVSDNQFIANMESLNNVLFKASVEPYKYDSFTITDYININYFNISSIDNINTSIGEASLDGNKVTWNIDRLRSGSKAKMTIDVTLKEEYVNVGGTYPTNSSTEVVSEITDNSEDVTTTDTPILSTNYVVMYDGNSPSGCSVSNVADNETKSVFEIVKISEQKPICDGYVFKGWKIVNEGIEKVNDDYFIMPEEDVTVRAVWSKLSLTKSVDGKVSKVQTLYNVMKDQAVMDNVRSEYVDSDSGIDFDQISSDTNGKGVYEKSGTENDENPIYYYRGNVDNNVIFGGFCWKMVVTTGTGGVKMIYNGVPTDGKCTSTGAGTQIGVSKFNTYFNSLADVGYMYGTRYPYSSKNVGIDYWKQYANKGSSVKSVLTKNSSMSSTNYYYADYAIWNGSQYVLYNSNDLNDTGALPVERYTWSFSFNDLKGKYSCFSETETSCQSVNYIGGGDSSNTYYLTLVDGNTLNDYRNVSNSVVYDGNTNSYILNSPINVSAVWYTDYSNYKGYYFCSDLNSTTCSTVYYIDADTNYQATIVSMSGGETYSTIEDNLNNAKWLYGNSVTYDGENYTLVDTVGYSPITWGTTFNELNNNHYSCLSENGTCSSVYYIFSTTDNKVYYITLTNGKTAEEALNEMLNYNTNSSTIKGNSTTNTTIDYWYLNNLDHINNSNGKSYSNYIEDTVYCNDRSYYNFSESGWNPDGGNTETYLRFGSYGRTSNPSVTCPRNIDKFTVSNTIGNGELDYPIGLLTEDEIRLAGGGKSANFRYYLWNGTPGTSSSNTATNWWTMSPFASNGNALVRVVSSGGKFTYADSNYASGGIRPVISIKPRIKIDGGYGTRDNPYTLEEIE